jgi:1-deoxy-D-xylulose-5-phosphate synthase
MPSGTGLNAFAREFPDRFFDVGIAEQHAVTFAAGLAIEGMRPVVAIYSTFLQRAYDQIIHDVCLTAQPVVFAIDRGGLVGDDGPTHHGAFDISFLRAIPNLVIMSPKDENELQHMLFTAFKQNGPVAIRYPRGEGVGVSMDWGLKEIPIGSWEILSDGADVGILAVGHHVKTALLAAEQLASNGINATVVNARFVKPLDKELLIRVLAHTNSRLVTVEENALMGGFGSAVLEELGDLGRLPQKVVRLGLPDRFVEQGTQTILREMLGLDAETVVKKVISLVKGE